MSCIVSCIGSVFAKVVLQLELNSGSYFGRVILALRCLLEPESGQPSSLVCGVLPTEA